MIKIPGILFKDITMDTCVMIIGNILFYLWWPCYCIELKILKRHMTPFEFHTLCSEFSFYFKTWYNPKKIIWNKDYVVSLEGYCLKYKHIWEMSPEYLIYQLTKRT